MLGKMEWFEHPAQGRAERRQAREARMPRRRLRSGQRCAWRSCRSHVCVGHRTTNVRDLGTGMTFDVEVEPYEDDKGTTLMVIARSIEWTSATTSRSTS
jgi:hypothetical protein